MSITSGVVGVTFIGRIDMEAKSVQELIKSNSEVSGRCEYGLVEDILIVEMLNKSYSYSEIQQHLARCEFYRSIASVQYRINYMLRTIKSYRKLHGVDQKEVNKAKKEVEVLMAKCSEEGN